MIGKSITVLFSILFIAFTYAGVKMIPPGHLDGVNIIPKGYEEVTFVKVVDGDTIKIVYLGHKINVRIIGIDTPEKYTMKTGFVECYAKEASQFAESYFSNANTVQIRKDSKTPDMDKYGRLLRHVYLNGDEYAVTAIKNGFGMYLNDFSADNGKELQEAQNIAISNKLGLWDHCDGKMEPVELQH